MSSGTFSRRSVLKLFGLTSAGMALGACAPTSEARVESTPLPPAPPPIGLNSIKADGYLSIVQGPTSSTETLINVIAPRLKVYSYEATGSDGSSLTVDKYETVKSPTFYSVDKLKISGLKVGLTYTLKVLDKKTLIDERTFSALDTSNASPRFGLVSCMCDDHSFEAVIDPMWRKLQEQGLDFLILAGDEVYVDSFEYVERQKATEYDLWQRYVDALKRLPLYHWRMLVPVFAVWDDHDYGTNDGDRDFVSKDQALRLFHAIYGGPELVGTWAPGPNGVSSKLNAFGQRFYLMDDRTFRQPNKNQQSAEPYGHWGQAQHEWLMSELAQDNTPAWLVNGNQFFNGIALTFKEAFEQNHPAEFVKLVEDLKTIKAPVVFASGDVHLSEIMSIPPERLGYETFELTSSSMHSFASTGWDNPMRLTDAYTKEYNFFAIQSVSNGTQLKLDVKSMGLAPVPYFSKTLTVSR